MPEININTGYIFKKTYRAVADGVKVIVHKGGTGSGKTFDIMLYLLYLSGQKPGRVITIVSESHPHLIIGAIRILKTVLKKHYAQMLASFIGNPPVWTHPETGSIIEFFSADRIDKALGARRDVLYGNEINSLKRDVWEELARRSELVIADFNPTSQFWLEDWVQDYDPYRVITSTYKDNNFLSETERERIRRKAERDPNFRRVHIDCEYGAQEGLVFTAWEQVEKMPGISARYGLDFGYSNDPTALVAVEETEDAIYIDELIYRTGLMNRDITALLRTIGIRENYDEIIADSAEPKSIDEIRLAGYNVKPAKKGADSVINGIQNMLSKKLYITKRSVNIIKELRNYSWVTDKEGRPTNKPVDAFNHGIDAIRYAIGTKQIQTFIL